MIAIDARLNAYRHGGIAHYTHKLLTYLPTIAPEQQWLLLEHRKSPKPLAIGPNIQRARLFTPPHHRLEQLLLPLEIGLRRPKLLHSPDFIPPLRRTFPAVITVHDVAFKLFPEILDANASRYYGQIERALASANAIIADSQSTANDLTRLLNVDPARIDVIQLATDMQPMQLAADAQREIGGQLWQADQFMVFVSTLEPRKNIPLLLRALRIALDRKPQAGYRLALAGRRGWLDAEIWQTLAELHLEEVVIWLDSPSDEEIRWLLSACRLYLNPSKYEGFGLPALEALACGAAVLVADASSLPEVVGDAGLKLPVDDPLAWADAIECLWADADQRQVLRDQAPAQAAKFSWQRTAEQTLAVYRRVLEQQR
ncbi:glycosyltransferase family 4 protein [Herpetosiphon llansteffanensis]